jgi:anti-sigma-K factor RskA
MRSAPNDIELVNRLAAEYVLGTMRGGARQRLERWRASSALVDERCRFWEDRLMPLLLGLRPMAPPPQVWRSIRVRPELAPTIRRPFGWVALAASVLLVTIIGSLLYWRTLGPGRASELATITAASGSLMWEVEIYGPPGEPRLSVRAGVLTTPPLGRDYELWALPRGAKPVSLGLLPYRHGLTHRALTAAQRQALLSSVQLAVSVEPPGGSPTGQPTGAVVFVAPLHAP